VSLEIKSITVRLDKKTNVKNTRKYILESELGQALLVVISLEEENLWGGKWVLLRNLAASCLICIPLCQLYRKRFCGVYTETTVVLVKPCVKTWDLSRGLFGFKTRKENIIFCGAPSERIPLDFCFCFSQYLFTSVFKFQNGKCKNFIVNN